MSRRVEIRHIPCTIVLPPGFVAIWKCRLCKGSFLMSERGVNALQKATFLCDRCSGAQKGPYR